MNMVDVVALYLKLCPTKAVYTEAVSKDWHQFTDRSISWSYEIRGMAIAISELQHGSIPSYHL